MRISDWSSDVCSSDLLDDAAETLLIGVARDPHSGEQVEGEIVNPANQHAALGREQRHHPGEAGEIHRRLRPFGIPPAEDERSEEHTSELQSLMRNSYAVFCLKKKNKHTNNQCT